jgi:dCTP deaminase
MNDSHGILPGQHLRALAESGQIRAAAPVEPVQIQPASLDLRLGARAYRIRASFLPGRARRVEEALQPLAMHAIDLTGGAVLERGCTYLIPLMESLALAPDMSGFANPKSSTGRLDVFVRLLTDYTGEFDGVAAGYSGPLYAEVSPRTFSLLVRAGSRLNQLRLRRGHAALDDAALTALVDGAADIDGGVGFSVDLKTAGPDGLIGWRAKRHSGMIDIDRIAAYDPLDYWDPVRVRAEPALILDPDEFYILVSREAVHIPPDFAAEMVPYDPLVGEFRVHYAGFFDPGFGNPTAGGHGSRAVLEVRSHEVPFVLDHGQIIGRLVYERLAARPERLYGQGIGSSYQRQGLALSKHFRR